MIKGTLEKNSVQGQPNLKVNNEVKLELKLKHRCDKGATSTQNNNNNSK